MTEQNSDAEPLWAPFKDVVEQLTDPVVKSTLELVSRETKGIRGALAGLEDALAAVADRHESTARRMDVKLRALAQENQELRARLDDLKSDVTAALENGQELQTSLAAVTHEDTRVILRELNRGIQESRSRERALDAALKEQLDRLRASAAADGDALRSHVDTLRARLQEELHTSLRAVAARRSAVERLSWTTIVLLCLVLVLGTAVLLLR
ncbi:hypothetical protein [Streptomyces sp. NPDC052701]|uniref:hypothetical protein n=1 Tax=Streptomyces sp. NPDC052701 TaxID=3155533 RepID=UPI003433DC06